VHKIESRYFYDPGNRQEQGHVEIKGDLRIGETISPEAIVIKEIVQMTPVLSGIHDRTLTVHLSQFGGHVLVESDFFKEGVKKPIQEKPGFLIQDKGKNGTFHHLRTSSAILEVP
jgi:hypothetical protein